MPVNSSADSSGVPGPSEGWRASVEAAFEDWGRRVFRHRWIALLGSGMRAPTVAFIGWFGPRGLASILFVLLILEEAEIPHRAEILSITVITVALSVILHGISAAPLANAYGRLSKRMGECEESKTVSDMPLREGPMTNNNPEP